MSYDQGYERDIKVYFDTHFHRLEERQLSPGMTLAAYQLRYDAVSSSAGAINTIGN